MTCCLVERCYFEQRISKVPIFRFSKGERGGTARFYPRGASGRSFYNPSRSAGGFGYVWAFGVIAHNGYTPNFILQYGNFRSPGDRNCKFSKSSCHGPSRSRGRRCLRRHNWITPLIVGGGDSSSMALYSGRRNLWIIRRRGVSKITESIGSTSLYKSKCLAVINIIAAQRCVLRTLPGKSGNCAFFLKNYTFLHILGVETTTFFRAK